MTHLVHSDIVSIRLFDTKWRVEQIIQPSLSTLKHINDAVNLQRKQFENSKFQICPMTEDGKQNNDFKLFEEKILFVFKPYPLQLFVLSESLDLIQCSAFLM